MCAILIKFFFCLSLTSALKLNQDPQFESTDATYDEDCGDRKNYKCWKKGGHSLEKKNAPAAPYMEHLQSMDDNKCKSGLVPDGPRVFKLKVGDGDDVVSLESCGEKCLGMLECVAFSISTYRPGGTAFCIGCIGMEAAKWTISDPDKTQTYSKVTPGR